MARAKNYTFTEVADVLRKGDNMGEIMNVTRYYPLLVAFLAPLVAKAPKETEALFEHFPEHLTANKVNMAMKGQIEEVDDEDDGNEGTTKAAPKGAYKRVTPQDGPYAGVKSMRLYKMAKDRGLNPEIRQTAAYYIDLLEKDDAKGAKGTKKAAKPAVEPEDDDDDDDEDDVPAPKAKAKAAGKAKAKPAPEPDEDDDEDEDDAPPPKKGTKKPAKKAAADDDDDWDI